MYVHIHVHLCVQACMHMHVEVRGQQQVSIPPYFFETVSLTEFGVHKVSLGWLARTFQSSPASASPQKYRASHLSFSLRPGESQFGSALA